MATIPQLSATDTLADGDLVPVYKSSSGDARKAAVSLLKSTILADSVGDLDSSAEAIADTDYFAVYDASQAASVKVLATTVRTYMQQSTLSFTTQRASPSSTGFTVNITNGSASIWLILTPTAGYATGTIVLPAVANAVDGQEVMVNCTQQVNALTVNGNGAVAVTGEPSTLAADDFFRLRYDLTTQSWFRVG